MFEYFDYGFLYIDGIVYLELKKCLYILIIVRIFKKFIMGLNIVIVLFGRINNNFIIEECDLFEVNSIENNCVMEDLWLYLKI